MTEHLRTYLLAQGFRRGFAYGFAAGFALALVAVYLKG